MAVNKTKTIFDIVESHNDIISHNHLQLPQGGCRLKPRRLVSVAYSLLAKKYTFYQQFMNNRYCQGWINTSSTNPKLVYNSKTNTTAMDSI